MKHTELDYLAYDYYVISVKNNNLVNDDFVGHLDDFIYWHNNHYNNLKYYYDLSHNGLRRKKLEAINAKQLQ